MSETLELLKLLKISMDLTDVRIEALAMEVRNMSNAITELTKNLDLLDKNLDLICNKTS
jgi:hypothetical protein